MQSLTARGPFDSLIFYYDFDVVRRLFFFFCDVGAGVVDFDYRGNVGVVLFNHATNSFRVKKGDKIAQFIVEKICVPKLVEVNELSETERGTNGYGSTGQ